MARFQLHCFGESGNAYKAALMLELAQCDWEAVFVDFFNGETRTEAFRALNPMGEVPVLVDGEVTLSQSGVIQDYLIDQLGQFGGQDAQQRREVWRWVLWDNHKLSSQAGMTRFLTNFLPEEKRPAEVIGFMTGRVQGALAVLDKVLAERQWLVGDGITAADISCCGYLYYPEPFGFEREHYPHITRWLNDIAALPHWKSPYDLMPRQA